MVRPTTSLSIHSYENHEIAPEVKKYVTVKSGMMQMANPSQTQLPKIETSSIETQTISK